MPTLRGILPWGEELLFVWKGQTALLIKTGFSAYGSHATGNS